MYKFTIEKDGRLTVSISNNIVKRDIYNMAEKFSNMMNDLDELACQDYLIDNFDHIEEIYNDCLNSLDEYQNEKSIMLTTHNEIIDNLMFLYSEIRNKISYFNKSVQYNYLFEDGSEEYRLVNAIKFASTRMTYGTELIKYLEELKMNSPDNVPINILNIKSFVQKSLNMDELDKKIQYLINQVKFYERHLSELKENSTNAEQYLNSVYFVLENLTDKQLNMFRYAISGTHSCKPIVIACVDDKNMSVEYIRSLCHLNDMLNMNNLGKLYIANKSIVDRIGTLNAVDTCWTLNEIVYFSELGKKFVDTIKQVNLSPMEAVEYIMMQIKNFDPTKKQNLVYTKLVQMFKNSEDIAWFGYGDLINKITKRANVSGLSTELHPHQNLSTTLIVKDEKYKLNVRLLNSLKLDRLFTKPVLAELFLLNDVTIKNNSRSREISNAKRDRILFNTLTKTLNGSFEDVYKQFVLQRNPELSKEDLLKLYDLNGESSLVPQDQME